MEINTLLLVQNIVAHVHQISKIASHENITHCWHCGIPNTSSTIPILRYDRIWLFHGFSKSFHFLGWQRIMQILCKTAQATITATALSNEILSPVDNTRKRLLRTPYERSTTFRVRICDSLNKFLIGSPSDWRNGVAKYDVFVYPESATIMYRPNSPDSNRIFSEEALKIV